MNITLKNLGIVLLLLLLPACEEVLEVCAPCGHISEGNVSISGDPSLDGIFESVIRLKAAADHSEDAFNAVIGQLALEYQVTLDSPRSPSVDDIEAVATQLEQVLFLADGVTTTVHVGKPRCLVDAQRALDRQRVCEDKLKCYVSLECRYEQQGSCSGVCFGDCSSGCNGDCLQKSVEAAEQCLPQCLGTCLSSDAFTCPGTCFGDCDGACTSFSAEGECAGFCDGLCDGLCESDTVFDCEGACTGYCMVPLEQQSEEVFTCAGECRGDCSEGACSSGECRGHFRPEGCDLPSKCDAVYTCQEMSKFIAWAYLKCADSQVKVSVNFDSSFSGDRAFYNVRAAKLERVLTVLLSHYAAFSILVDGVDMAGELTSEMLSNEQVAENPLFIYDAETLLAQNVVEARGFLPLSMLKTKVGVLIEEATRGTYTIAAGNISCVRPAFEDAKNIMDTMLPWTTGPDSSIAEDRTDGIYRVIDGMNRLLFIGDGVLK